MIISIDGPAASGKSTTAKKLANRLNYLHLDTGAMYRAVTLYFYNNKVDLSSNTDVKRNLKQVSITFDDNEEIHLNGLNVATDIRRDEINRNVSKVSAIFEVREKMVELQRVIGDGKNVVVEGRDIGTRVFPNADYKFYIIADVIERGRRRFKELEFNGEKVQLVNVIEDLRKRDQYDSTREHSPLTKAEDAIEVDTTYLSIDEQVNKIITIINDN
jgi:CMP/dCMP kinase